MLTPEEVANMRLTGTLLFQFQFQLQLIATGRGTRGSVAYICGSAAVLGHSIITLLPTLLSYITWLEASHWFCLRDCHGLQGQIQGGGTGGTGLITVPHTTLCQCTSGLSTASIPKVAGGEKAGLAGEAPRGRASPSESPASEAAMVEAASRSSIAEGLGDAAPPVPSASVLMSQGSQP